MKQTLFYIIADKISYRIKLYVKNVDLYNIDRNPVTDSTIKHPPLWNDQTQWEMFGETSQNHEELSDSNEDIMFN